MTGTSVGLAGDRIIDFGNGQPSLSLLPLDALRVAADHCLRHGDASLLQYGADQGDETFATRRHHLRGGAHDVGRPASAAARGQPRA